MTEGIARDLPEDLHHLLLINNTAVGRAQNGLKARNIVADRFGMMPPLNIFRDRIHRSRAIECDRRNDIVDRIGSKIHERLPHSRRFQLKNAEGIARRQKPIRLRIVKIGILDRKIGNTLADHLLGIVYDRKITKPEEVELEKPELRNGIHIVLRDHRVAAHRLRYVLGNRT